MSNVAIKENDDDQIEGEDENSDEDILENAKENFERASHAEAQNRKDGLEDLLFRGYQINGLKKSKTNVNAINALV